MNKDNLDVQLEPVSEDELKTLTEMFNTMVASIKSQSEELVNFFKQVESENENEIKVGMDLAVFTYDTDEKILEYADAYNPRTRCATMRFLSTRQTGWLSRSA